MKTTSIYSNWAERDKHLRGADFLDVETFFETTFKGIKFTEDENGGTAEGLLTLHAVSKPITLNIKAVGEGEDPCGGHRCLYSYHHH